MIRSKANITSYGGVDDSDQAGPGKGNVDFFKCKELPSLGREGPGESPKKMIISNDL